MAKPRILHIVLTVALAFLASGFALAAARPACDFFGTGTSALLWRNGASGQVYLTPLRAGMVQPGLLVHTEPDPSWQIVAAADFDGDGKADLLWWNSSTGRVYLMLMDGGSIKSEGIVYTEPDTAWTIVGAGDFNGDGRAGILWRHAASGAVYLMPMNGMSVLPGSIIYTEPDPAWQIIAVADLDGDGKADLLWWNSATGQVWQMLMDGPVTRDQRMIYTEPDTRWIPSGIGDFAGDGHAGLLWRHQGSGAVCLLQLDGTGVGGQSILYTEPDLDWRIAATGDYDGDGRADILWLNDRTGQAYLMLMRGSSIAAQGMLLTGMGSGWNCFTPQRPLIAQFLGAAAPVPVGAGVDLTPVFSNGLGLLNPGGLPVTSGRPVTVVPFPDYSGAQSRDYLLTVTDAAGNSASRATTLTRVATPTFSIRGNAGVPWASLTVTPPLPGPGVSADAGGAFGFSVPGGWWGSIAPSCLGYAFSPEVRTLAPVGADQNLTFLATPLPPMVSTGAATGITGNAATLAGTVDSRGLLTGARFRLGIAPGDYAYRIAADPIHLNTPGAAPIAAQLSTLTPNRTYYYVAEANNDGGLVQGSERNFITARQAAIATSAAATAVGTSSATLNGTVNAENDTTTITFEYGPSLAYGSLAAATPGSLGGTTGTAVSAVLTGLVPNRLHHFRVDASNGAGTAYGQDLTFTTGKLGAAATTLAASAVTGTGATLNATVNAQNDSTTITFQYGPSAGYGSSVAATPGTLTTATDTAVSAPLTGLVPNSTYHFRVVTSNSSGTVDGADQTFATAGLHPGVSTQAATAVTTAAATLNGTVSAENDATTISFQYGPSSAYGSSVAANPASLAGTAATAVSANLTGLAPNSTYHFQVTASNSSGTASGSDQTFTTGKLPASDSTLPASAVTGTGATLNGTVNAENDSTTITFQYGSSIAYGGTVAAVPGSLASGADTAVSAALTGLVPNSTLHFRVATSNSSGTATGGDLSFSTGKLLPTAVTGAISNPGSTSTTLNGTVNPENDLTSVTFQYGLDTSYGSSSPAVALSLAGYADTPVATTLTGLTAGTPYHYRLVATNSTGTAYGQDQTFTTPAGVNLSLTGGDLAPGTLALPNATPGELLTLMATVTLPEGLNSGLTVRLNPPPGMGWVGNFNSATAVIPGTFSGSPLIGTPAPGNSAQPGGTAISIQFGDVTVTPNNRTTNTFQVKFQVFALNTGAPATPVTATVLGTGQPAITSDPVVINPVSPVLTVTTPSLSPASLDAGATTTITFTVKNTGTSTAYDGIVDVDLGPYLTPSPSAPAFPAQFSGSSFAQVGGHNHAGFTGGQLAPGQTATFNFTAVVQNSVPIGSPQSVRATVDFDSYPGTPPAIPPSPPAGFDQLAFSVTPAAASFTVSQPTISTQINSVDLAATGVVGGVQLLTVGERFTLEADLTFPHGTLGNGVVTIPLPAGLSWITTSGTVTGDPFTTAGTVALTATTLTYTYPASDVNPPGSSSTLKLAATGYVTTAATRGAAMNISNATVADSSGTVTASQLKTKAVTPSLTVTTSFNPATAAGGDTVLVTLTVSNDGSAASSNAYATVLTDVLSSPNLAFASFVSTQPGWVPAQSSGTVTYTDSNVAGLAPGASASFSFNATVLGTVLTGTVVSNAPSAVADCYPGGAPVAPAQNRAVGPSSGSADLTIQVPTLSESLFASSLPQTTGTAVAVGEQVQFQFAITFPVGTSQNAVFTQLTSDPATFAGNGRMVVLSAGVINAAAFQANGNTLATPNPAMAPATPDAGGAVTLSFGGVTVTPAGKGNNVLLISVIGRVSLDPLDVEGAGLRNGGAVATTLNPGGAAATPVSLTVVEPVLLAQFQGSPSPASGPAGSPVSFTLLLKNTGTSPAFQVAFLDILDPSYGSVTLASVPPGFTNASSGNTLDLTGGTLLPGDVVALTIQAAVQPGVPAGTVIHHQASVSGSSNPVAGGADVRGYSAISGNAAFTVTAGP